MNMDTLKIYNLNSKFYNKLTDNGNNLDTKNLIDNQICISSDTCPYCYFTLYGILLDNTLKIYNECPNIENIETTFYNYFNKSNIFNLDNCITKNIFTSNLDKNIESLNMLFYLFAML